MSAPTGLRIEIIRGAGAGMTLVVDRSGPWTIGRSAECRICVPEPTVSRRHAVIEPLGGGFRIRDVGSLAGTKLFGQLIGADGHLVEDGDEFELGACVIRASLLTEPIARPLGPSAERAAKPAPLSRDTVVPAAPAAAPASDHRRSPAPTRTASQFFRDREARPQRSLPGDTTTFDAGKIVAEVLESANSERVKPLHDHEDHDTDQRAQRRRVIRERLDSFAIWETFEKVPGERVDLALDERTHTEVALRRIEKSRIGWFARRRFLRDCEKRHDLDHPNLSSPVAWGLSGEWTYVASPHPPGATLDQLLRYARGRQPLPVPLVAFIGASLAKCLARLHPTCEVEVSPRRIILCRNGRVILQDLGPMLPRLGREPDRYTAPEQDAGKDLGACSRIFSLGVVLYEAFTGEPIESARKSTLRSVDTVRIELPASLADVTMRALEVRPGDRHSDATELAEDLEAELDKLDSTFGELAAGDWLVKHYPDVVR